MTQLLTPGHGQDIFERFERAHTDRDRDKVMDAFGERIESHPDPFEPPLLSRVLAITLAPQGRRPPYCQRRFPLATGPSGVLQP